MIETPWFEVEGVSEFIEAHYKEWSGKDVARALCRKYKLYIDSEDIRNFRRAKGWKKKEQESLMEQFIKVVFVTCFHAPYHDEILFELFIEFLKYFKPDKLFILGDFMDWYQVSRFDKNPNRLGKLQEDVDVSIELLDEMQKVVDDIEFLDGNHEYRMEVYLKKHPGLHGLRCLEIPSLLGLRERNIKHYSYHHPPIKFHRFQIHHGNLIRKYSGWTAKGLYEKYGGNGICGHSHRMGSFIKRNTSGIWGWWESGCMCRLDPEYQDFVDWVQGWSVGYFDKRKGKELFYLEQVPVIKGKFLFEGRMFRGGKKDG